MLGGAFESLDPKPMPTPDTLTLVAQYLQQYCLITTEIYVCAPKYRKVEIAVQVAAPRGANSGTIADTLTKALLTYFNPLTGGADMTVAIRQKYLLRRLPPDPYDRHLPNGSPGSE